MSDSIRNSQLDGRYQLGPVVERGRLGPRFTATSVQSKRPVIIEVIEPAAFDKPEDMVRFEKEATAMATLEHPGLASLVEVGALGEGASYIVSESPNGTPLSKVLSTIAPMPPEQAATLVLNLLDALAQAHSVGVVHGGICPENLVLVTRDSGEQLLRLKGFAPGLASEPSSLAPRFLAPEQAGGDASTYQSDLYSVGLLLQVLLTGQSTEGPKVDQERNETGAPLRGPLIDVMERCLAQNPALRPASADEAYRSIQRCLLDGTLVDDHEPVSVDDNVVYLSEHQSDGREQRESASSVKGNPGTDAGPCELPPLPPPDDGQVSQDLRARSASSIGWRVVMGAVAIVGCAGLFFAINTLTTQEPPAATPPLSLLPNAQETVRPVSQGAQVDKVRSDKVDTSTPDKPPHGDEDQRAPASSAHDDKQPALEERDLATTDSEAAPTPSRREEASEPSEQPERGAIHPVDEPPATDPVVDGLYVVRVDSIPSGALVRSGKDKLGRTPLEVTWSVGSPAPVLKLMKFKTHSSYYGGRVHLRKSDAGRTRYATLRVIGPQK